MQKEQEQISEKNAIRAFFASFAYFAGLSLSLEASKTTKNQPYLRAKTSLF
jgi:hypothetical protein